MSGTAPLSSFVTKSLREPLRNYALSIVVVRLPSAATTSMIRVGNQASHGEYRLVRDIVRGLSGSFWEDRGRATAPHGWFLSAPL
jgi:hypothetical protein